MSKFKLLIILSFILFLVSGCTSYPNTNPTNKDFSAIITEDYFNYCSDNKYGDDCFVVHKFGENSEVSTATSPITNNGVYMTPTTLTSLNLVSDNTEDNINGIGARTVKITGLSTNWEQVSEIVEMDGINPVNLINQYYRVYRMQVLTSGTYASQTEKSHQGNLILSNGTNNWAEIRINGIALGQTEMAVYTVPKGYSAHLGNALVHINGNKVGNIYMFMRTGANITTAPYSAIIIKFQAHGVLGPLQLSPKSYSGAIPEMTDFGFMGNTDVGTTETSVDFEILLIKNQ